jgi:hypothetical protein
MDNVWIEMAKASPIGLAMIAIVYIFVTNENKREQQRIENGKERAAEQRAYDMQVQSMWANNIKAIIDKVDEGQKAIASALIEHERMSRERYEKMGITDDLLQYAKENLRSKHEPK